MNDTKVCERCGEAKPLSDFGIKRGKSTTKCKACLAELHREYYAKHRDDMLESVKAYYRKNREQILAKDAERRKLAKAEKDALKPQVPEGYRLCRVCGQIKPLDEFNKNGSVYRTDCRTCKKKYMSGLYLKNIDENRAKARQYDIEHAEQRREYRLKHKEHIKEKNRAWHLSNLDRVKAYREANKDHITEKQREYRERNKDRIEQLRAEYYAKNPHYHRDYDKRRTAVDPLYKFKKQIRNAIRGSFLRLKYDKRKHTEQIVGCDMDTLVAHLRETYRSNYGEEWNGRDEVHIDHIVPLSTAKSEDEVLSLCHYENLQLLKPEDNIEKSDSLEWSLDDSEVEDDE